MSTVVAETPQKTSISDVRQNKFHTGRKILIIDDCRETAENLQRELSRTYTEECNCSVECITDPEKAIELIKENKYDAIVLDLHMPKITGTQLIKELGDELPPTLINTGSLLKPAIADLSIAIQNYQTETALKLFNDFVDQAENSEHPVVPIAYRLKTELVVPIEDQIDSLLLIAEHSTEAMSNFTNNFDPDLIGLDFTEERTHSICELGRAIASIALDTISELDERIKQRLDLDQIITLARELESKGSSTIFVENQPNLTANNIHDEIINPVASLMIKLMRLPRENRSPMSEIRKQIDGFYAEIRDYKNTLFDPLKLLQSRIDANNIEFAVTAGQDPAISQIADEKQEIRKSLYSLLDDLPRDCPVTLAHHNRAKDFQEKTFGSFFQIKFHLNTHPESVLSASNIIKLGRLQMHSEDFHFEFDESSITLNIRSNIVNRFSSSVSELPQADFPDIKFDRFNSTDIYTNLGSKKDIIAFGGIPGIHDDSEFVIRCFDELRMIAQSSRSHPNCCEQLLGGIAALSESDQELFPGADFSEWFDGYNDDPFGAYSFDDKLVRLKMINNMLVIEKVKEELFTSAKQLLQDLGIPEDSIRIAQPREFAGKW